MRYIRWCALTGRLSCTRLLGGYTAGYDVLYVLPGRFLAVVTGRSCLKWDFCAQAVINSETQTCWGQTSKLVFTE